MALRLVRGGRFGWRLPGIMHVDASYSSTMIRRLGIPLARAMHEYVDLQSRRSFPSRMYPQTECHLPLSSPNNIISPSRIKPTPVLNILDVNAVIGYVPEVFQSPRISIRARTCREMMWRCTGCGSGVFQRRECPVPLSGCLWTTTMTIPDRGSGIRPIFIKFQQFKASVLERDDRRY